MFSIILISFSYYSAYRVGKDLGRDLEVILTVFGMMLDSCLNEFGGFMGMILLLLFIQFQYSFQIMRSLCQDFGRFLDSFCNDLGRHIAMILLLLFMLFQYSFQIMRSPCQEDCEADVSIISTCCHAFVVFNLLSCFSRFQLAVTLYILSVQFPDNAKPMSR